MDKNKCKRKQIILLFFCCFLGIFLCSSAWGNSDNKTEDRFLIDCKEKLKEKFPQLKVRKIKKGPMEGLCEVWAGSNIFYFAPSKKLLFFGEIWDSNGKSLTQESRNLLLAELIKNLDTTGALTWGKGSKQVILIVDPFCPHCKKVEKLLLNPSFEKELTVKILFYPISPASEESAKKILCSKSPINVLLSRNYNIAVSEECLKKASRLLKKTREDLRKLGIRGVPVTIINGKVIIGSKIETILQEILEK